MMRNGWILAALFACAGWTASVPVMAQASRATGTVPVSATVMAECRLDITPLNFGTYNPVETNAKQPADADAELRLICTPRTTVQITIGRGQSPGGGQRRMSAGAVDRLSYEIYRDAARTIPWSSGSAMSLTTSQSLQLIPLYGRIPAGQDTSVGAYSDSVVVSIVF